MKHLIALSLFALLISLYSCSKNNSEKIRTTTKESKTELIDDNYRLSRAAVNFYAKSAYNKYVLQNDTYIKDNIPLISDSLTIADDEGNDLITIYNFGSGNGFIVLSNDLRSIPVLAYSGESYMTIDTLIENVEEWLYYQKQSLVEISENHNYIPNSVINFWLELDYIPFTGSGSCIPECPDYPCCIFTPGTGCIDDPCQTQVFPNDPCDDPTSSTVVGPLLTSMWGQAGDPLCNTGAANYNDDCPTSTDPACPCGHKWAGCVAVAMGQIMYYHQSPTDYNWSNINDNFATTETARLFGDIGDAVNMDYGCGGSGSDTKNEVEDAFENDFGYNSSTNYEDYDHSKIKSNLDNGWPVILRGGERKTWLGIPYYTNGHAWVCDGYTSFTNCQYGRLYLHMNWGWNGTSNGSFAFNNFNPGVSFNYKRGMVINIHP